MTAEKKEIRISVRHLVEFILREGDLRRHKGGFADKEAMQEGSRLHRKIQKSMGGAYQAEVALRYTKEYEHYKLILEGRADGILPVMVEGEPSVMIDEIKGVYRDLDSLEEPIPVHASQAKCYAYIYSLDHNLSKISVRMSYCNMETEEMKYFQNSYTRDELEVWFHALLEANHRFVEYAVLWEKKRNASIIGLPFPFTYRPGQEGLVKDVYRTILREKQLFVQAPTGIGKTMSSVYPAVQALGQMLGERIFYLTAKTITRSVAEEAVSILKSHGMCMKALTITAREKLCPLNEVDCNPAVCERAKGHYDRANAALYHALTEYEGYGREDILKQSADFCVCPYELQLDIANFVDMIICDYNYVFDPAVRLKRFFGEGSKKGSSLFIIDEAHNLVERGREMYSAELVKEDFLKMKRQVRAYDKALTRCLERCNHKLLEYKRQCDSLKRIPDIGDFILFLMSLAGKLEEFLGKLEDGSLRSELLEFYFQVRAFLGIYELVDENYLIYGRHDEEGHFILKLFCVNPAANLQSCMDKGRSTILMSATLLPVTYYQKLLSGRRDDYAVYIPSPFQKEKRRICIGRDVSTLYKRRGPAEYEKIADHIHGMVQAKKGNYLVFFPSYELLRNVQAHYFQKYPEHEHACILQTPSMKEAEREAFLQAFQTEHSALQIGFCVMGGIFGEGIDLVGDALIGAVIVGTGLPGISEERELLRAYYDKDDNKGFDYAYRFPGMNKVLQSAGRVIRTTEDKGVILLLDERFAQANYRSLFPLEWDDIAYITSKSASKIWENAWKMLDFSVSE